MTVLMLCVLFALVQGPDRLDVQVVDASGAPVVASVHEGGADGPVAARTDARGRFSVERERATVALTIVAPGFSPVTIPASADAVLPCQDRAAAGLVVRAGDGHGRPSRAAWRRFAGRRLGRHRE